jgi:glutaredoxin
MANAVTVFGARWCHDTTDARRYLQQLGVPYEFVDIDEDDEGEHAVIVWNDGKRRIPTIVVNGRSGQTILKNPTEQEIDRALNRSGIRAA